MSVWRKLSTCHSNLSPFSVNVPIDWMMFEENEREPHDKLKLTFEAAVLMDEDERRSVLTLLDTMILKHQIRTRLGTGETAKQAKLWSDV